MPVVTPMTSRNTTVAGADTKIAAIVSPKPNAVDQIAAMRIVTYRSAPRAVSALVAANTTADAENARPIAVAE